MVIGLEAGTMTDADREILRYVARQDGRPVTIAEFMSRFHWLYLITKAHFDRLAVGGWLMYVQSPGGDDSYRLSESAIGLADTQGWFDRPEFTRNPPKISTLQSVLPTKEDRDVIQWIAMYGGSGIHASTMRARFGWTELVCARVANRLIASGLVQYGKGGEVPSNLGHERLYVTSKGFDLGVLKGWLNADGTPRQ